MVASLIVVPKVGLQEIVQERSSFRPGPVDFAVANPLSSGSADSEHRESPEANELLQLAGESAPGCSLMGFWGLVPSAENEYVSSSPVGFKGTRFHDWKHLHIFWGEKANGRLGPFCFSGPKFGSRRNQQESTYLGADLPFVTNSAIRTLVAPTVSSRSFPHEVPLVVGTSL